MNAFLALREEDLRTFDEARQLIVRERVESSLKAAEFLGNVVELFGPKLANTLTIMAGGEVKTEKTDEDGYPKGNDIADDGDEPYGPGYINPQ